MIAATITDAIIAAPLAFIVGLALGLGLSSRYRIIRQKPPANGGNIP
jgi:hypothetical protein